MGSAIRSGHLILCSELFHIIERVNCSLTMRSFLRSDVSDLAIIESGLVIVGGSVEYSRVVGGDG